MNIEKNSNDLLMPAEWEKHSATQLHWPSNVETWPDERLQRVEKVYLKIIKSLSDFEQILLLVENNEVLSRVLKLFKAEGIDDKNVLIKVYPINDVWARDCGPIFVKDGNSFMITNWEYNAWGEKYPPWDSDNTIPEFISELFGIKKVSTKMVLEGGSIDVNGVGDLLTTESVLLNPNRNPGMSKDEIEHNLKNYLGVENIIWLKSGLAGDDTDGHIDDLTRFLNEETVLTMVCEDENDINYKALQENLAILQSATLKNGGKLNIETLPLPKTKIEGTTVDGSEFVPASYANFYVANGCVLVPLYDERYDQQALDLFKKYFPDREIIGIDCADLVWGQGSIHCITQQLYGTDEY
jgi:agmatine deiminase|tara:strand:+ start:4098 stop:5159 length:1062 start_codon:yes stop_codon:yes gene_type:complete